MKRDDIVQAATGGPDFTPKEWPEPAARLSHDRGADAFVKQVIEDIEEAERQTGEPLDSEGIANILHENLREAALSVPAPTLPALDVERLTKAMATVYEQDIFFKKGGDWSLDADLIIREYEALRDAV